MQTTIPNLDRQPYNHTHGSTTTPRPKRKPPHLTQIGNPTNPDRQLETEGEHSEEKGKKWREKKKTEEMKGKEEKKAYITGQNKIKKSMKNEQ